jgi:hypothetical protein
MKNIIHMKKIKKNYQEQIDKDMYEFWKKNSVLSWDEFRMNLTRAKKSEAIKIEKEKQKKKIR